MNLNQLVAQVLAADSPGGASVTPEEGQSVLTQAIASGASAADLSALAAQAGIPISEGEIQQFIDSSRLQGNLAAQGSVNDVYEPIPIGQGDPDESNNSGGGGNGGSGGTGSGGTGGSGGNNNVIVGSGNGNNGNPSLSPAQWAQVEQGNTNYLNAIQNSVFSNPNIYLPDGSTQTVSFGQMPNYSAYVQNNPDLLSDFNSPENPFSDMAAFGKWHWETHGKNESGRQMPMASPQEMGMLQPDVRVNLSPQEQAIYDTNQRIRSSLAGIGEEQLQRVYQNMSSPLDGSHLFDPSSFMDFDNLSEITTDPTAGGMEQVRDAMVDRYQPLFDRRREDMKERLMVEGHNPGNESWENQFDDLGRQENDFYLGAMEKAGAEQQRLFSMEGQQRQQDMTERVQQYGMGRDWRGNQINEALTERNLPLNELNALRSGTQIGLPNMTPFQGQTFSAPDFAGAEQETYNRAMYDQMRSDNNRNALFSGLGSIAGTALGGYAQGGGFDSGLFSGLRGMFN